MNCAVSARGSTARGLCLQRAARVGAYNRRRMELVRVFVIVALLGIVVSLGSALFHLSAPGRDPKKMVRALTWRIALSVALFLLLMLAWYFGLISPHGL